MIFSSLKNRIAIIFVGLLGLVMALILIAVSRSGEHIISAELERELSAGAKIFERLVKQNQNQLEISATVLSADFGFREAIATQDRATILSVLRNHGSRIGARVMMVASLDGNVIADTQHPAAAPSPLPFTDLLSVAETQGRSSGFVAMADGKLYQLVVVPVQAPVRIAWVVMGFPVDDAWAEEFSAMSGLMVSIVRSDTRPAMLASSLPEKLRVDLVAGFDQMRQFQPQNLILVGKRYQTLALPMGQHAVVILQRQVEESEAPFLALQSMLWAILVVGVVVFMLGSVWLARRIARPVSQLVGAAQRLESGDYAEPVSVTARDEIGQLASAFERMRERVAEREQRILKLAYQDTLTGLPNRTRFLEELARLVPEAPAAIAISDLDRFRLINDALGHAVGDRLLVEVSRRLEAMPGRPGLLARLGGDEFAFLLPATDANGASQFAEQLLSMLREPVLLDGQRLDVGASLGISLYPADGSDANVLLRRAELAMYTAKKKQRGFALASPSDISHPPEQLSLIGEMRDALARNEFTVFYQPLLDLHSGTVTAVEALIRWQHPERGLVPPIRFIPFAEQTGFIREITPWLVTTVMTQAATWRASGLHLSPSINISALDLLNTDLVGMVKQLLTSHNMPPEMLCLEITESALMEDPELALEHLSQLAACGVRLAVDDYGAGQASLAYVKTLPIHKLKIDQLFVRSLADSGKDAAIVRSTIALGHALGLQVVAEGVETEADLLWLRETGCDYAQGYWIAKPMPSDQLPGWLSAWKQPARTDQTNLVSDMI